MRSGQSLITGAMLLGVLVLRTITLSAGIAGGDQPGDLAKQGWRNFLEVLAGDQSQFELVVHQLEQAAAATPTDVHNLYTLGRAYFYDAITNNHLASAAKAERTFARVLELDPKHEALAFHGSVLTILSQGKDLEKFRQGAREMNRMVEQNPDSLTARLSRGLTAQALPSGARSMMGNDAAEDLGFASRAFEGIQFHYAPHAEVGSKAFVGESYLLRGDVAKAQASFKAALAVPLPSEPGAKAGRVVLQDIIRKRLNGSEQNLTELLRQAGLGSCNTCHLRQLERGQFSRKTPETVAALVNGTSHTSGGPTAPESELRVNIVGLKSSEGRIRVALFDSEKTFLHEPLKAESLAIEQAQCHWQVKRLSPGSYALAVYQDRNGNGKLDRNMFGIPLEPYGFSNNARGVMGPPNFRDACFQVTGSSTQIEVRLE